MTFSTLCSRKLPPGQFCSRNGFLDINLGHFSFLKNHEKTSIVINAPQLQDVFLISEPINDSCSDPKLPNWDSNLITEFSLTCEREELVSTPDLYYNTGAALSCLFCFFLDSYEVNSPSSLNVKPF